MSAPPAMAELRRRLAEVHDLYKARELLIWDLETMMPPSGAGLRAEQLGTISRIAHERSTADGLGELLEELRPYEESQPYEDDDASIIRVARRDYDRARHVPAELRSEISRTGAHGLEAWHRAREANDYDVFRPALERNLELQSQYIDCFQPEDDPYDVLVAEREPGMSSADLDAAFGPLREELVPLVAGLGPASGPQLEGWPAANLEQVLERVAFDRAWGRLDTSVHPFMASFGPGDIRLTTSPEDNGLRNIFAALHELGHGLYEQGIDPTLERTPLADGASGGLHESQSLLWENHVGRSRPFARWLGPVVGVDADALYRAATRIEPSLIRIGADRVTYSLHVIFRVELERALVGGTLAAADLRDAWNDKVRVYLGLEVPDDRRGVLQDIHWSDGLMGVFPSYALGHIASVQIWERARADLPDLDDDIERGEFAPLREWLREHVHRHGRRFEPKDLLERVTGSSFDPAPLLAYVRRMLEERGS
jgi:carboxypeptidase Taq